MDYSISGRNCELLRVELESTEAVIAEVGKMIYTRGAVEWKVVLPGRGLAGKLAAGFERKLSGGSVVIVPGPGRAPGTHRVSSWAGSWTPRRTVTIPTG